MITRLPAAGLVKRFLRFDTGYGVDLGAGIVYPPMMGGERILPTSAHEALLQLAAARGNPVSGEALRNGPARIGDPRGTISDLRQALSDVLSPHRCIVTIRRRGYALVHFRLESRLIDDGDDFDFDSDSVVAI